MTTLQTPQDIASVAAKIVGQDLGLAKLFSRDLESDFGGGSGSTVRVRVNGSVKALTRDARDTTTPITSANLVEQFVDVTLNKLVLSSVPLAVGHTDLDLADYTNQVTLPQARAIVRAVENDAVEALQGTPETSTITYDASNPARTFTQIRSALRQNGVSPDEPIFAAVGVDVFSDLLDAERGRGFGFDDNGTTVRSIHVHESNRLAPGEIVAFVKSAFNLVVRAPRPPEGAAFSASVREEDFALTVIRTFDANVAVDRSLVEALVAVTPMPLAVDRDGSVELVENGGAVRVLTAA